MSASTSCLTSQRIIDLTVSGTAIIASFGRVAAVAGTGGNVIYIIDARGNVISNISFPGYTSISGLCWSTDGRLAVSARSCGRVLLLTLRTRDVTVLDTTFTDISHMSFDPFTDTLALTSGGNLCLIDTTGQRLPLVGLHAADISHAAWAPTGGLIATLGVDGSLAVTSAAGASLAAGTGVGGAGDVIGALTWAVMGGAADDAADRLCLSIFAVASMYILRCDLPPSVVAAAFAGTHATPVDVKGSRIACSGGSAPTHVQWFPGAGAPAGAGALARGLAAEYAHDHGLNCPTGCTPYLQRKDRNGSFIVIRYANDSFSLRTCAVAGARPLHEILATPPAAAATSTTDTPFTYVPTLHLILASTTSALLAITVDDGAATITATSALAPAPGATAWTRTGVAVVGGSAANSVLVAAADGHVAAVDLRTGGAAAVGGSTALVTLGTQYAVLTTAPRAPAEHAAAGLAGVHAAAGVDPAAAGSPALLGLLELAGDQGEMAAGGGVVAVVTGQVLQWFNVPHETELVGRTTLPTVNPAGTVRLRGSVRRVAIVPAADASGVGAFAQLHTPCAAILYDDGELVAHYLGTEGSSALGQAAAVAGGCGMVFVAEPASGSTTTVVAMTLADADEGPVSRELGRAVVDGRVIDLFCPAHGGYAVAVCAGSGERSGATYVVSLTAKGGRAVQLPVEGVQRVVFDTTSPLMFTLFTAPTPPSGSLVRFATGNLVLCAIGPGGERVTVAATDTVPSPMAPLATTLGRVMAMAPDGRLNVVTTPSLAALYTPASLPARRAVVDVLVRACAVQEALYAAIQISVSEDGAADPALPTGNAASEAALAVATAAFALGELEVAAAAYRHAAATSPMEPAQLVSRLGYHPGARALFVQRVLARAPRPQLAVTYAALTSNRINAATAVAALGAADPVEGGYLAADLRSFDAAVKLLSQPAAVAAGAAEAGCAATLAAGMDAPPERAVALLSAALDRITTSNVSNALAHQAQLALVKALASTGDYARARALATRPLPGAAAADVRLAAAAAAALVDASPADAAACYLAAGDDAGAARAYVRAGDWTSLQKLVGVITDPETLAQLGAARERDGRAPQAIDLYLRAGRIDAACRVLIDVVHDAHTAADHALRVAGTLDLRRRGCAAALLEAEAEIAAEAAAAAAAAANVATVDNGPMPDAAGATAVRGARPFSRAAGRVATSVGGRPATVRAGGPALRKMRQAPVVETATTALTVPFRSPVHDCVAACERALAVVSTQADAPSREQAVRLMLMLGRGSEALEAAKRWHVPADVVVEAAGTALSTTDVRSLAAAVAATDVVRAARLLADARLKEEAMALLLTQPELTSNIIDNVLILVNEEPSLAAAAEAAFTERGQFAQLVTLLTATGNYDRVASLAVTSARAASLKGAYAEAHTTLARAIGGLFRASAPIPASLHQLFAVLHAYVLARRYMATAGQQQHLHLLAAFLLVRVTENIELMPLHDVAVATTAVIECVRAGLSAHAHRLAVRLVAPGLRERIDERYVRKIEAIVRHGSTPDSATDTATPCPYCSTPVPSTDTECHACMRALPVCAATGRHLTCEMALCDSCGLPLDVASCREVGVAVTCGVCGTTVETRAMLTEVKGAAEKRLELFK